MIIRIMPIAPVISKNFEIIQMTGTMCGSRKYPYYPHGRDLPYDSPPLWIFQNRPLKYTPRLLRNFQNFRTPRRNIAISYIIEVNE